MDRIKIRATDKRHGPDLTRNWVVGEPAKGWDWEPGDAEPKTKFERLYTCRSFKQAIAVADQIAYKREVDAREVIALSIAWAL